METRHYIRTWQWTVGQYDRLEGGYEKETRISINENDNIVLGNPKYERIVISKDDLLEFLDKIGP